MKARGRYDAENAVRVFGLALETVDEALAILHDAIIIVQEHPESVRRVLESRAWAEPMSQRVEAFRKVVDAIVALSARPAGLAKP